MHKIEFPKYNDAVSESQLDQELFWQANFAFNCEVLRREGIPYSISEKSAMIVGDLWSVCMKVKH